MCDILIPMQNTQEKMIDKIENRLQFLITILIFFLAVFPNIELQGCILVVFYIIDYILFTTLGKKMSEKRLTYLNTILFIGIGSYIIPLTVLALSAKNAIVPVWQGYTWMALIFISIWFMILVPLILLIMILIYSVKK